MMPYVVETKVQEVKQTEKIEIESVAVNPRVEDSRFAKLQQDLCREAAQLFPPSTLVSGSGIPGPFGECARCRATRPQTHH